MARFSLEWRQLEQGPLDSGFAHRLAYAPNCRVVQELAEALGDRAWRREFRLLKGTREVFTDLHRIQDWVRSAADLPEPSRRHIWRRDLERSLVADTFLDTLRKCLASATQAEVLLRTDADALLRFAHESLRRPSL
jgi:hypothetical protein